MELLLVRHGEAASAPMDEAGPPLNQAGKEEVKNLLGLLRSQSFGC